MRIGQLARKSGTSVDTIRWYEKIGLIRPADIQRTANNYRQYPPAIVERLRLIKQSKALGFSLQEVGQLLELTDQARLGCDTVGPMVDEKLILIEAKIRELMDFKRRLQQLREECQGDCRVEMERQANLE